MDWLFDSIINFFTGGDYGKSIMESITQWIIDQVAEVADSIVFDFAGNFKPSITYFNQLFPNAKTYYSTFIAIGIILVVALFSFVMLFNLLGIITGNEEKPLMVVGRTFVSILLVIYSGEIMNYFFKLGMDITNLISGISREEDWASGIFSFSSGRDINLLVNLILMLIILWKVFKLILEVIERYLVMCLYWYLSQLANATFATKATSKIFSSFYQGVFVQILVCSLNIWFLRMTADLAILKMASFGSGTTWEVIVSGLILVGWLEVATRIDQYIKSLGLGIAQTGGNLGRAIGGTFMTAMYMGRMFGKGIGSSVSHRETPIKDIFGKTHTSAGNRDVSNAAGLSGGVMSGAGHVIPNQDGFMSTDHRGKAAATIVGDAAKQVVLNSNIAGMKSGSVDLSTLSAGATQGDPFKFSVNSTDGDVISGHVSRLAEENGVKGIESVGATGEKQYTYFDKGSGLPTGTGLEKGQTSTLYDANKATATQTANGEIDVNTGAWNRTTMEAIGFQQTNDDSKITLMEKGHLSISDATGEKMGTVITSSHEGFESAKSLGSYYQDPLTGNQMVGIPESKLDGISLDADSFSRYQNVRDIIGDNAMPKGTETLETHGRQSYISDMGNGKMMHHEIVTADNLDYSKLNTYRKMSLPNGGDVYCRSRIVTPDNQRGSRNGERAKKRK